MVDPKGVIRRIVARQLDVDVEQVVDTAYLGADLGADSLDFVELVMELEEEFDIEIGDDKLEEIETVAELIDIIVEVI